MDFTIKGKLGTDGKTYLAERCKVVDLGKWKKRAKKIENPKCPKKSDG